MNCSNPGWQHYHLTARRSLFFATLHRMKWFGKWMVVPINPLSQITFWMQFPKKTPVVIKKIKCGQWKWKRRKWLTRNTIFSDQKGLEHSIVCHSSPHMSCIYKTDTYSSSVLTVALQYGLKFMLKYVWLAIQYIHAYSRSQVWGQPRMP